MMKIDQKQRKAICPQVETIIRRPKNKDSTRKTAVKDKRISPTRFRKTEIKSSEGK